jgi:hypothetical protein
MRMGIWTVATEISLRFVPVIDTGGWPVYGGLEFTARPDLGLSGVEMENFDLQNPDAVNWFPHLKAGFEEYGAESQKDGKPLGALRLMVIRVYSHETDSNERVMRYVAREALREIFTKHKAVLELPAE